MLCKFCGSELPDDSKYCIFCGKKLISNFDEPADEQMSTGRRAKRQAAEAVKAPRRRRPIGLIIVILLIITLAATYAGLSVFAYKVADAGGFESADKLSGLIFWDKTFSKYTEYGRQLDLGRYESAATGFKNIRDYRESDFYYKESVYMSGVEAYDNGKLEQAMDKFQEIPDFRDVPEIIELIKKDAFALGEQAFADQSFTRAREYFKLSDDAAAEPYLKIIAALKGEAEADTLKDMMDFEPTKDLLLFNDAIALSFLKGDWYTEDWQVYFKAALDDDGNYDIEYNMARPDYGANAYFYIENGELKLTPDGGKEGAITAFIMNVGDWDTVYFTSMATNYTYTLHRNHNFLKD